MSIEKTALMMAITTGQLRRRCRTPLAVSPPMPRLMQGNVGNHSYQSQGGGIPALILGSQACVVFSRTRRLYAGWHPGPLGRRFWSAACRIDRARSGVTGAPAAD
jgi:hypothetical protein